MSFQLFLGLHESINPLFWQIFQKKQADQEKKFWSDTLTGCGRRPSNQALGRSEVIVRKIDAVETLGCVSVFCSDKTGQFHGLYQMSEGPAAG